MTTCEKCGGRLYEKGVDPLGSTKDGTWGHKPGCPAGLTCTHQQYATLFNAKRRVEEELSLEKDRNATLERQLAEAEAHEKLWRKTVEKQDAEIVELQRDRRLYLEHAGESQRAAKKLESELADAIVEEQRLSALKCRSLLETHQFQIAQWQNAHLNTEARIERLADALKRAESCYVELLFSWRVINGALWRAVDAFHGADAPRDTEMDDVAAWKIESEKEELRREKLGLNDAIPAVLVTIRQALARKEE